MRRMNHEEETGLIHYKCLDESCGHVSTSKIFINLDALVRSGGYDLVLVARCVECDGAAMLAAVQLPTRSLERIKEEAARTRARKVRPGTKKLFEEAAQAIVDSFHLDSVEFGKVEWARDAAYARALGIDLGEEN